MRNYIIIEIEDDERYGLIQQADIHKVLTLGGYKVIASRIVDKLEVNIHAPGTYDT